MDRLAEIVLSQESSVAHAVQTSEHHKHTADNRPQPPLEPNLRRLIDLFRLVPANVE